MDHNEAVEAACKIVQEAHDHIGYQTSSDCFCRQGGYWGNEWYDPAIYYRNDGEVIEFVRQAVREKIARERDANGSPTP